MTVMNMFFPVLLLASLVLGENLKKSRPLQEPAPLKSNKLSNQNTLVALVQPAGVICSVVLPPWKNDNWLEASLFLSDYEYNNAQRESGRAILTNQGNVAQGALRANNQVAAWAVMTDLGTIPIINLTTSTIFYSDTLTWSGTLPAIVGHTYYLISNKLNYGRTEMAFQVVRINNDLSLQLNYGVIHHVIENYGANPPPQMSQWLEVGNQWVQLKEPTKLDACSRIKVTSNCN